MQSSEKSFGQIAFEKYNEVVASTTYDKKAIPDWNNIDRKELAQHAWNKAAAAVLIEFLTRNDVCLM